MSKLFHQFRLNRRFTVSCICYKFHYLQVYICSCSPWFLFKRKTTHCFSNELCSSFFFSLFPQENVCNASLITLELVEYCPRNSTSLQNRLISKKCSDISSCNNERLVYHCVRSEDSLVEVCAPEGHIIGNATMDYRSWVNLSAIFINSIK